MLSLDSNYEIMPNSQEALLTTKAKTGMIRMLRSDIGLWKNGFNLRFKKLVVSTSFKKNW